MTTKPEPTPVPKTIVRHPQFETVTHEVTDPEEWEKQGWIVETPEKTVSVPTKTKES